MPLETIQSFDDSILKTVPSTCVLGAYPCVDTRKKTGPIGEVAGALDNGKGSKGKASQGK